MKPFSLVPPLDPDSSYYKFKGGASMHRFAMIWALIEIVNGVMFLVFAITSGESKSWFAINGALGAATGFALLAGFSKKIWWLYIPELASMNYWLLYYSCSVIANINTGILIWANAEKYRHHRFRSICGEFGSGIFYLFIVLIDAFLICVIIRAMQYAKLVGSRDGEEKKVCPVSEKVSNDYSEIPLKW